MRLLTTSALGLAAIAVAAVARRNRDARRPKPPSARVDPEPLVTWLVRVPANTPADARVSICGNTAELGTWNARGVALLQVEPRLYRASVHVPRGTMMEYKITRGSWDCVEKCGDGSERLNRQLRVTRDEKISVEVEAWGDLS